MYLIADSWGTKEPYAQEDYISYDVVLHVFFLEPPLLDIKTVKWGLFLSARTLVGTVYCLECSEDM